VLGLAFNAIATSWWVGYVLLLDRIGEWIRRIEIRRVIENLSGAALVALGIRLAVERR
jgi:threonine/homoserine/homoserine lactone efflux protein